MAIIVDVNEQVVQIDHNDRIITVNTNELRFTPKVGDEIVLSKDKNNEVKVLLITRDSSFSNEQPFGNKINSNETNVNRNSFAFKCAIIGLFIFGIILGPIAIFKHKSDSRPKATLIIGIIATIGAIIMMYLNQKLMNSILQ